MLDKWNKIYNLKRNERIKKIIENINLTKESIDILENDTNLENDIAENMIENQIGTYSIPLGIVPNLNIDGKDYIVPMVTEEPSVIAALSNAFKTIKKFSAEIISEYMIGQIVIIKDDNYSEIKLNKFLLNIYTLAEKAYPSIYKRGGGLKNYYIKNFENYTTIFFSIDTKEAMGANIVNTILEYITKELIKECNFEILYSILSNYSTDSLVKAKFELSSDIIEEKILKKIVKAVEYANLDVYRAVTNNKGIMNGIDAVVIATGNDFRSVEASISAYASKDGYYKSLSNYMFDEKNKKLYGELIIPLSVGTKGGSISLNPKTRLAFDLLGNIDKNELRKVIACVGLAQNFSALRALVTKGIQKGHMKLHNKSIAILNGANSNEIDLILKKIEKYDKIDSDIIKKIIKEIRKGKND